MNEENLIKFNNLFLIYNRGKVIIFSSLKASYFKVNILLDKICKS